MEQDYVQAAIWFRRAADQGNVIAQSMLGTSYKLGYGVPQDYVQAHMWLNLAASNATNAETRDDAAKKRDEVATKCTPVRSPKLNEWRVNGFHSERAGAKFCVLKAAEMCIKGPDIGDKAKTISDLL